MTDSFGPLAPMRDGLGFLPGSACPHFDGEVERRPKYHMFVRDGFPSGFAADDGATALHWAARNGHLEIVLLLLKAGAAVNVRRGLDGPAPVHFAISHGNDTIAIELINAGASLDMVYFDRNVKQYARWHHNNAVLEYIRHGRYRYQERQYAAGACQGETVDGGSS